MIKVLAFVSDVDGLYIEDFFFKRTRFERVKSETKIYQCEVPDSAVKPDSIWINLEELRIRRVVQRGDELYYLLREAPTSLTSWTLLGTIKGEETLEFIE